MIFDTLSDLEISYLPEAVKQLCPTCRFIIRNNELIWRDNADLQPSEDDVISKVKEITFGNIKRQLLDMNIEEFSKRMRGLTRDYPELEIISWEKQEQEARAYLKDDSVPTPLLDSISEAREIEKEALAQKIVEKADKYTAAVGFLMGRRQKIEDIINACETVDDLLDIKVRNLWAVN